MDLAFVTSALGNFDGHLDASPVGREPMLLAGPAAEVSSSAPKYIDRFLSYNESSTTYRQVNTGLRRAGIKINSAITSTDPVLIKALLLKGYGWAVLPYWMLSDELAKPAGTAVIKAVPILLGRDIYAVKLAGKRLPKSMSDLISRTAAILSAQNAKASKIQRRLQIIR